ncbi:hypothetical protein [Mitsuaria sp. BK037]|uniref:hypothetical protein n=1 Tax=Mitsuaria sp. BK037 TaxID=2587122 RepID=UPI0016174B12|nr:hypothetical protein [Mitsuaria sp. BK037]MBB3281719.1 hypothetical protein [Mitsuaria sp. BK037]
MLPLLLGLQRLQELLHQHRDDLLDQHRHERRDDVGRGCGLRVRVELLLVQLLHRRQARAAAVEGRDRIDGAHGRFLCEDMGIHP